MNFSAGRSVWAPWLAGLCVAMLLVSTTVQATHFCELSSAGAQEAFRSQPASPSSAVCLICLMAHSAATALLVVVFSPTFRKRVRATVSQVRPRLLLESFQLYVRPPPAS
jgi:hypothetical protein